MNTVCQRGFTE